jgi:dihydroorotase
MEMPNTKPPALTQELLEDKYRIAAHTSPSNYSFFMGVSNENIEDVLQTDPQRVCGVKVFMGSSTGNMLVDNETTLRRLFSQVPMLIAAHCEDEQTIRRNTQKYRDEYGENIPMSCHPEIRDVEACFRSSSLAVSLAREYGTRFHVLHISTAEELELFDNSIPLEQKKITAEVCVYHLYFTKDDYAALGSRIKCNPAIKENRHRIALLQGLLDNRLDIVATDHAPHTLEEKSGTYFNAPAGLPLVQHSLPLMLDFYHQGLISLENIVEKMCHAPAKCFRLRDRGYLREGYPADVAVVDLEEVWTVRPSNILYHCGWSPLENRTFKGRVTTTFVNGNLVWDGESVNDIVKGQRLEFYPMT